MKKNTNTVGTIFMIVTTLMFLPLFSLLATVPEAESGTTVPEVGQLSELLPKEDFPEKLPVASLAELKAFALSQVSGGGMSLSYSSGLSHVLGQGGWDYARFVGDVTEVMSQINNHGIIFQTADPDNETVDVHAYLHDKDGFHLFWGHATEKVFVDKAGNASVSPSVEIRLTEWFPLDVGNNTTTVIVRAIREGGYRTIVFHETAYSGRVWIPVSLIGSQYEFVLFDSLGNSAVYNGGIRQDLQEVVVNSGGFKIKGFHDIVLSDESIDLEYEVQLDMSESPDSPVFKITTAGNERFNLNISLLLDNNTVVRPMAVKGFKVGEEENQFEIPVQPNGKIEVDFFEPGKYYLWPIFEALENPPYTEQPGKG
jgi:hypothetical protein